MMMHKLMNLTEAEFYALVLKNDWYWRTECLKAQCRPSLQAFAEKNDLILTEELELIPRELLGLPKVNKRKMA